MNSQQFVLADDSADRWVIVQGAVSAMVIVNESLGLAVRPGRIGTGEALGEAVGRTFVTTTIGDEGKQIARQIVEGIEGAFRKNLASVEWMDAKAREASEQKLHKINNKVGYPERWRDYSSLKIGRESLSLRTP